MDNQTLNEAVNKLKQGDDAYFEVIYEATKTKVYYTILTIVKDPSMAEDIMQDTYLKMLDSIKKYKNKNQFQAWLTTIARNLAINTFNKRKKEVYVDEDVNPNIFGSVEDQSEKAAYLREIMRDLSHEEQEVVIRHVILGEKHKTIAKALNKPLGTITWMYQNALKKIRTKAGDDHDE